MPKFRTRPVYITAWQYTGQPKAKWPAWLKRHYGGALGGTDMTKHVGRYAMADEHGDFWRWIDADRFNEIYEPA